MGTFFSRERFGVPQILAGGLLLIFVAQCCWLIAHQHLAMLAPEDISRVQEGWSQWRGQGIAGTPTGLVNPGTSLIMRGVPYDSDHSPLWYLIESAPVAPFHVASDARAWLWLTRAPFVFIGALLGASLWYVSRRLYGNAGGYTALALYCFSPAILRASTLWLSPPNMSAAWGIFGSVFTSIAVSHTLYAPREVVLWNWRRILLLGTSLALAVGSYFSLALIVPVLLVFMLYLAIHRSLAVVVILSTACGVALALLFAVYFFHLSLFAHGLGNAALFNGTPAALRLGDSYSQLAREMTASGPILVLLVPAGLVVWATCRGSRYFGNSAPLLVALFFMTLRVLSPHEVGSIYGLLGAIFLFVFVAGVIADLLETAARQLTMAVVIGLLTANAVWNLVGLYRIGG